MNSVVEGEGRKHVEKEKKVVGRLERHPADGLPLKHNPKKGHGGKYTWEGPLKEFEAEAALDEKDPNYPDGEGNELVVGEVEVAKVAEEGVARLINAIIQSDYYSSM